MTLTKVQLHDLHPTPADLAAEVLAGLTRRPRYIAPKFFYDSRGSQLFEAITETPEYYPTRAEIAILRAHSADIAAHIGTGSVLVEPGSGSCAKVRLLLDGLQPCAYVPMDISRNHLWLAASQLAAEFPWLEVHAACTDFTREMAMPNSAPAGPRVAFFPGSSIGNFDPDDAVDFLAVVAGLIGLGGWLLIGVDLKKDRARLEAAYDDAAGVTADFNLNLLVRINRELGADFDLGGWSHRALYNVALGRVEMHLVSRVDQSVTIEGRRFNFAAEETIQTENSYKYTTAQFSELAQRAGLDPVALWCDPEDLFSVHLLRATDNVIDL